MSRVLLAFTTAAVLLYAGVASAEPSPKAAYRREVFLADAASWALIATTNGTAAGIGGVGLLFGGPVIHLIHQHPVRAAISLLGLRVGLPLLAGIVVGRAVPPPTDCPQGSGELCPAKYFFVGALAGMVTGEAIDWIFLSGPAPAEGPPRRSFSGPTLQVSAHGFTAGYAGTF